MSAVIEVQDLHFSYGKTDVLSGLNLTVQPGEIVVLLGPNGAGKTTLIENMLGTFAPKSGTVQVLGINPRNDTDAFWSKIGLVQQHWSDHAKWRVTDQLNWAALSLQASGVATKDPAAALAEAGLENRANTQLRKLSGGERRRLDFAVASIGYPELLIADEPTTGLDPEAKSLLHDRLGQMVDQGTTCFMTTHDLAEAEKLADRICILNHGKIIEQGSANQLRAKFSGVAEITWVQDGQQQVHVTSAVEAFVAALPLDQISQLTITRPTLEDAYLALVSEDPRLKQRYLLNRRTVPTSNNESK